jgi:hypothetical protein
MENRGDFPRSGFAGHPLGGLTRTDKQRLRLDRLNSLHGPGASMEELMKLVAASFVRHGIECPAQDAAPAAIPAGPTPPAELPEHSYRKNLQAEPTAT